MISLSGEVFIQRQIEDVFDFVADERNNYDPRVHNAELLTALPIGVGTKFRSESKSMGRTVEMIMEITAYQRPSRLCSSTRLASMDIHSTLVFEATAEGTVMHWSSKLEPRGFLRLLSPLMASMGQRQTSSIWANLKNVLEQQPAR